MNYQLLPLSGVVADEPQLLGSCMLNQSVCKGLLADPCNNSDRVVLFLVLLLSFRSKPSSGCLVWWSIIEDTF